MILPSSVLFVRVASRRGPSDRSSLHETDREKYFPSFLFAGTHLRQFGETVAHLRLLMAVLVMLAPSALPGCGRSYWSEPGATAERFAGDSHAAAAVSGAAAPETHRLDGRWHRVGAPSGSLTMHVSGTGVAWEYESFGSQGLAIASQYGDPGTVYRGAGIGTVEGDDITLTGRLTVADPFSRGPLTFRLKRSGSALKGTARGPSNVPVDVEFVR